MGSTEGREGPTALRELATLFLRLGGTAFGGPAAHIAMMRDEVVERRKWMTSQEFLDLLGATNLIPGPNSTEMAIHIGYARAGWKGLIVSGASFILPAMAAVMALAWAYVTYGALPEANAILYGIKPVVIALVAYALLLMGRTVFMDVPTLVLFLVILVLYLVGLNEIALLGMGGLAVLVGRRLSRSREGVSGSPGSVEAGRSGIPVYRLAATVVGLTVVLIAIVVATSFAGPQEYSPAILFLTFLKIGGVLYGSGYVLLAFLRADFVGRLGWLTEQQLLDAVSVGQVTPGPVFTTATFIGFVLGGWPGALVATAGIFLPAFAYVALSHRFIPRIRASPRAGAFLDGVNAASLGLMAGVLLQLGRSSIVDPLALALFLVSLIAIVRFKVNSTWLILAGAAIGLAFGILGWPLP